MSIFFRRASGCALALLANTSAAWAGADDDRFELVSADHRVGLGAANDLLPTDLRTGQPVAEAVIFAPRIDMAPDGMAFMTTPVTALRAAP